MHRKKKTCFIFIFPFYSFGLQVIQEPACNFNVITEFRAVRCCSIVTLKKCNVITVTRYLCVCVISATHVLIKEPKSESEHTNRTWMCWLSSHLGLNW